MAIHWQKSLDKYGRLFLVKRWLASPFIKSNSYRCGGQKQAKLSRWQKKRQWQPRLRSVKKKIKTIITKNIVSWTQRRRNNVWRGGGVVFKNIILIAFFNVSRQFRSANTNLTLKMAMSLRHKKQGANLMNNWRCFKFIWLPMRWRQTPHRWWLASP